MSADNTIIILGTKSKWKHKGDTSYQVPERKVYRVAHVQTWDNYYWYQENEPYNVGAFLYSVFKHSVVHESLEDANNEAFELYNNVGYVEYGIQVVETDYVFYSD